MRSSRMVAKVRTSLWDRPPCPLRLTHTTTEAWCTSKPAQQAATTSMVSSLSSEGCDHRRRTMKFVSCHAGSPLPEATKGNTLKAARTRLGNGGGITTGLSFGLLAVTGSERSEEHT